MLQVAQRSLSSPPHLGIDMNGPRVSDGIDSIVEIIFRIITFRLTYLNLSIYINTYKGLIKLFIQTKSKASVICIFALTKISLLTDNLNVQLQPTESFSYAGNFIANNTDEDRFESIVNRFS